MKRRGLAFILLCLLAPRAGAEVLQIRFDDGRPATELGLQRLEASSLEWYVAANELVRVLDLERAWKPELGKLELAIGETRLKLTVPGSSKGLTSGNNAATSRPADHSPSAPTTTSHARRSLRAELRREQLKFLSPFPLSVSTVSLAGPSMGPISVPASASYR